MKTFNVLPFAFAIMIFSGCYTQLVVEDDDPWSTSDQPAYTAPPEPILIYAPDPQPACPFGPVAAPSILPGNSNPIVTAPAPAPVQRTSGVERSGSQTSSQATNRNSGATRSGGR